MPTKKTIRSTGARPADAAARHFGVPKQDKQMGMIFVIFLLFVSLAIISFALYRVYNEQTRLLSVIDSLSYEVSEQQVVVLPDGAAESNIQYKDSEVADLRLGYKPCPATFTGPCDDLMIYRLLENGSKEVLVPSVRGLSGAPLTNELLQPLAINTDGSRIAFGAWAYGSTPNENDGRVWIVETATGKVLLQSTIVPYNAVYSPDMLNAAYFVETDDGEEHVMVIDLEKNEDYLAARATGGTTYKDGEAKVSINWLDNNTIAVIEYDIPAEEGMPPTISGEREITIN